MTAPDDAAHQSEQLTTALSAGYGIEVVAFVQLKTVTGVVTADGMRYVWKTARPRDTDRRLALLSSLTDAMSDAGLPAAGPLRTRSGGFCTPVRSGEVGYLQPWLPGRHVQFANPAERLTTVATLAHIHRWSSGFGWLADPDVGGLEWHTLSGGALPVKMREKWRVLQQVWPTARAQCADLASVEEELGRVVEAVLSALDTRTADDATISRYGSAPFGRALCHRDVAPHNVLWGTTAWPVSFIDFDHAGWDDPLIDLMQVSNHTFSLCDPGPNHFSDLLAAYQRIAPLSPDRQAFTWDLLRFPDILVRAVMEWVRDDCPPQRRARVVAAVRKERLRWRRWAETSDRL